jgi:hypothetical protein
VNNQQTGAANATPLKIAYKAVEITLTIPSYLTLPGMPL